MEKRVLRAFYMVQLGEVSAGRQALEGASLATGDERTLKGVERPRAAPCSAQESRARRDCSVHSRGTVRAGSRVVREERPNSEEGSRTRTTSMTADHLRPLVEHASLSAVFGQVAALLAQNMVPEEVMVRKADSTQEARRGCARHRGG